MGVAVSLLGPSGRTCPKPQSTERQARGRSDYFMSLGTVVTSRKCREPRRITVDGTHRSNGVTQNASEAKVTIDSSHSVVITLRLRSRHVRPTSTGPSRAHSRPLSCAHEELVHLLVGQRLKPAGMTWSRSRCVTLLHRRALDKMPGYL